MDGPDQHSAGPADSTKGGPDGSGAPVADAPAEPSAAPPTCARWRGYWLQPETGPAWHWMTLDLVREGREVRGVGHDELGAFTISGTCSDTTWTFEKAYETGAVVRYHGVAREDLVDGLWTLGCRAGRFCIWRD